LSEKQKPTKKGREIWRAEHRSVAGVAGAVCSRENG